MNRTIIIGRIVKDIELKYTTNKNTAVCGFTIAVDRKFKQEGQPESDFFNCTAWGKTAEFISKYFSKGVRIAVEGRLQNRSWTDAEDKKHYITEIVVESVYFADGKKEGSNNTVNNNDDFSIDESDDELPFN